MAKIKKYTKKDGSTAYQFNAYLGVDPLTGKTKRTTRRGFKTQKEAKLALARLEYEISTVGFQTNTKINYQQMYEIWLSHYKNTVKESSYAYTVSIFERFILPKMNSLVIDKITIASCQKLVDTWFNESPKRYKRIKNYASKVLNHAVSLSIISDNPMEKVIIPVSNTPGNKKQNEQKEYYSKDQLILFLKKCSEYNQKIYLFFRLLAYTGMRKGEVLALNWEDVSFIKSEVCINKTLARGEKGKLLIQTPKTKNSYRNIIIDNTTLNLLKEWKIKQKKELLALGYNTSNSEQLLFSNQKNQLLQPSMPAEWMTYVLKDTKLPKIKIHGFRHTHCSLLFESGASIKEVQERLGHSDIRTTMDIYTHVTESAKNEVANNFSEYINF